MNDNDITFDTRTFGNADLNDAPRLRGLVSNALDVLLIDWPTAKRYRLMISDATDAGTLEETGRQIRAELRAVK